MSILPVNRDNAVKKKFFVKQAILFFLILSLMIYAVSADVPQELNDKNYLYYTFDEDLASSVILKDSVANLSLPPPANFRHPYLDTDDSILSGSYIYNFETKRFLRSQYTSRFASDKFFVSGWVKLPHNLSNNYYVLGYQDLDGSLKGWYLQITSGEQLHMGMYQNSNLDRSVTPALELNRWYHYVGIWNGTDTSIYLDGVLNYTQDRDNTDSTSYSATTFLGLGNVIGGGGGLSNYADFDMDMIAIFNGTFNPDYATFLYNSGSPTENQNYPYAGDGNATDLNNLAIFSFDFDDYYFKLNDSNPSGFPLYGAVNDTPSGMVGNCIDIEDSNSWESLGGINDSVIYDNDEFFISFWFKIEQSLTNIGYILSTVSNYDTNLDGIQIYLDTDERLTIYAYNNGSSDAWRTSALDIDKWYHAIAVWNTTDPYLIVNNSVAGTQISNGISDVGIDQTNRNVLIVGDGVSGAGSITGWQIDGMVDELAFFNGSYDTAYGDYLFNSGSPTTDQQYPFGELTTFEVTALSPADNTKTNTALDVTYRVNDSDNATGISCDLYVDDTINLTNASVINNTISVFNATVIDGYHTWYVNCTDGDNIDVTSTYNFILDTSAPIINSESPSVFNTTVFDSYTMNIKGNITDNSVYRVNRTIYYPNATVFYNNYSGDLVANTTIYEWDDTFNTSEMPNGIYTMFIDSADSHTGKHFKEATDIKKLNAEKKLSYTFGKDKIDISMVGGTAIDDFNSVDTKKLIDRYTFEFNMKSEVAKDETMMFRVESDSYIDILKNSLYKGHLITKDYWIDFEGIDGDVTLKRIDDKTIDVTVVVNKADSKFVFKSLGGLNENNVSIEFEIDNCIPSWVCSGYDSCNTSDQAPCNSVTDTNVCGLNYTGDYSEFSPQSCNYCTPTRTLNYEYSEDSCEAYGWKNGTVTLDNWATCCDVTNLKSDCMCEGGFGFYGDDGLTYILCYLPEVPDEYFNTSIITNQTWWFSYDCYAYQPDYTSDDVAPATIDTLMFLILTLGLFIPIIITGYLVIRLWSIFRGK